jgi:hypothetical protein
MNGLIEVNVVAIPLSFMSLKFTPMPPGSMPGAAGTNAASRGRGWRCAKYKDTTTAAAVAIAAKVWGHWSFVMQVDQWLIHKKQNSGALVISHPPWHEHRGSSMVGASKHNYPNLRGPVHGN